MEEETTSSVVLETEEEESFFVAKSADDTFPEPTPGSAPASPKNSAPIPAPRSSYLDLVRIRPIARIALLLLIVTWIVLSALSIPRMGKVGQNVFGALGSTLLFALLWSSGILFDDSDTYYLHIIILGILMIANAILCFTLGDRYRIVAFWIVGFSIASSVATIICAFLADKPVGGVVFIFFGVVNLVLLLLFALLRHGTWIQYQHCIGSICGLLVVAIFWVLACYLDDCTLLEDYQQAVILDSFIALIFIVNIVFRFVFGVAYAVIGTYIAGWILLQAGFFAAVFFSDNDRVGGWISIAAAVLGLGSIPLMLLV